MTVAGVAIVVAGVSGANAQAAPFVGKIREATGTFKIQGADKQLYEVAVTLRAASSPLPDGTSASLSVRIAKCAFGSCGGAVSYTAPLKAQEGFVADDMSAATITTSFAGLPLKLTWAGGSSVASGNVGVAGGVTATGAFVGEPGGGEASVDGSLLGVPCYGQGSISGVVLADAEGSGTAGGAKPPSRTPAAFARKSGRGPACVKG